MAFEPLEQPSELDLASLKRTAKELEVRLKSTHIAGMNPGYKMLQKKRACFNAMLAATYKRLADNPAPPLRGAEAKDNFRGEFASQLAGLESMRNGACTNRLPPDIYFFVSWVTKALYPPDKQPNVIIALTNRFQMIDPSVSSSIWSPSFCGDQTIEYKEAVKDALRIVELPSMEVQDPLSWLLIGHEILVGADRNSFIADARIIFGEKLMTSYAKLIAIEADDSKEQSGDLSDTQFTRDAEGRARKLLIDLVCARLFGVLYGYALADFMGKTRRFPDANHGAAHTRIKCVGAYLQSNPFNFSIGLSTVAHQLLSKRVQQKIAQEDEDQTSTADKFLSDEVINDMPAIMRRLESVAKRNGWQKLDEFINSANANPLLKLQKGHEKKNDEQQKRLQNLIQNHYAMPMVHPIALLTVAYGMDGGSLDREPCGVCGDCPRCNFRLALLSAFRRWSAAHQLEASYKTTQKAAENS